MGYMKKFLLRFLLLLIAPVFLIGAVLVRIWDETKSIPKLCYLDLCGEWKSLKLIWKDLNHRPIRSGPAIR